MDKISVKDLLHPNATNRKPREMFFYLSTRPDPPEGTKIYSIFINQSINSNGVTNFLNRIYDYKGFYITLYFFYHDDVIHRYTMNFECNDKNIKCVKIMFQPLEKKKYCNMTREDIIKYCNDEGILYYRIYE